MINKTSLGFCISVFTGLTGTCFATEPVAQGELHIVGRIVDPVCTPVYHVSAEGHSTFHLADCPAHGRNVDMSVSRLDAVASTLDGSAVKAQCVADSADPSHDYSQQFVLVDLAGQPVRSGNYVVTLTTP